MQDDIQNAQRRATEHAKLLTYKDSQVLVYLFRNDADDLKMIVQMWVAHTDEQIRAEFSHDYDDLVMVMFDAVKQDNVAELVEGLGLYLTPEKDGSDDVN